MAFWGSVCSILLLFSFNALVKIYTFACSFRCGGSAILCFVLLVHPIFRSHPFGFFRLMFGEVGPVKSGEACWAGGKGNYNSCGCSDGGNLLRRVADNRGNLQTAEIIVIGFWNWLEKVCGGCSTHCAFIVLSRASTPFPPFIFREPSRTALQLFSLISPFNFLSPVPKFTRSEEKVYCLTRVGF